MQGHDNGGVHIQKVGKHTVVQLRGQNLQEGNRAPRVPNLEGLAAPEVKAAGGDKILAGKAGLGEAVPREAEPLFAAGVEHAVQGVPAGRSR